MNEKNRRYHSRDRIKICIVKYLFEKECTKSYTNNEGDSREMNYVVSLITSFGEIIP